MSQETMVYAAAGVAVLVFILWQKGYFGSAASPPASSTSSSSPGDSQRLFRLATRAAILEAQDAAADKIAEKVRESVISNLSAPFFVDPPPPASGT